MEPVAELSFCYCTGFGFSDSRIFYTDKDRMLLYEGEEHPLGRSIAAELAVLPAPCGTAPASVFETGRDRLAEPAPLLPVGTELVSVQFTDASGAVFDVRSGREEDLLGLRDFLAGLCGKA